LLQKNRNKRDKNLNFKHKDIPIELNFPLIFHTFDGLKILNIADGLKILNIAQ